MKPNILNYQKYNQEGLALLQQDRAQDALNAFLHSIKIQENLEAYAYLAIIYDSWKQHREAVIAASSGLKFNNRVPLLHRIAGFSFYHLGEIDNAQKSLELALRLDPRLDLCNYFLGQIACHHKGLAFKAIEYYKKELKINPNFADCLTILGNLLAQLGLAEEAVPYYSKGVRLKPSLASYSFLLYIIAHDPSSNEENLYKMTLESYNAILKPIKESIPENFFTKAFPAAEINKKLRIGLVSRTFRLQAVEMWIRDVFKNLSQEFELYFYHFSHHESDPETDTYFKAVASKWINITDLNDAEAAQTIRNDQVDILVDLTGYVWGNRIALFLYKAAPVQINWLHYYATTGLPEFDYLFADKHVIPESSEKFYVEPIYRLPDFLAVFKPKPHVSNLEPAPEAPVKKNNYITFGYMSRFHKVNAGVLQTWIEILKKVANARFLISSEVLVYSDTSEYILNYFEKEGIDRSRIILEKYPETLEKFLLKYNEIDIVLDSFPFSGATSLYDACWMGVPTIMLKTESWSGRGPSACLEAMGTSGLTAKTTEEYITNATTLAHDPDRIQSYRQNLRESLMQSPLCNYDKFSKDLAQAFRYTWEQYCNKHQIQS